ncbi:hypothetical protein FG386_002081 [Cryptosporidium ryanae]|uniref:uncharacterized protein n=1 Tax=Cryptosporidium ryanae TaxID=515981 RepID=UPI00351A97FF|nr:hypothetical protein FG386_002081 [Cryptosporidium ryanae]
MSSIRRLVLIVFGIIIAALSNERNLIDRYSILEVSNLQCGCLGRCFRHCWGFCWGYLCGCRELDDDEGETHQNGDNDGGFNNDGYQDSENSFGSSGHTPPGTPPPPYEEIVTEDGPPHNNNNPERPNNDDEPNTPPPPYDDTDSNRNDGDGSQGPCGRLRRSTI